MFLLAQIQLHDHPSVQYMLFSQMSLRMPIYP